MAAALWARRGRRTAAVVGTVARSGSSRAALQSQYDALVIGGGEDAHCVFCNNKKPHTHKKKFCKSFLQEFCGITPQDAAAVKRVTMWPWGTKGGSHGIRCNNAGRYCNYLLFKNTECLHVI